MGQQIVTTADGQRLAAGRVVRRDDMEPVPIAPANDVDPLALFRPERPRQCSKDHHGTPQEARRAANYLPGVPLASGDVFEPVGAFFGGTDLDVANDVGTAIAAPIRVEWITRSSRRSGKDSRRQDQGKKSHGMAPGFPAGN